MLVLICLLVIHVTFGAIGFYFILFFGQLGLFIPDLCFIIIICYYPEVIVIIL